MIKGRTLIGLAAAVIAGLALAACATRDDGAPPPKTEGQVDLKRYTGTWYELARMPMFFQRNCVQSEAHYTVKGDGNLGVLNRCRTSAGDWQEAIGTATPQGPGVTDKLSVEFDNWFSRLLPGVAKGDYWILAIDDHYRTAVVGSPTRKYLWLLSRTPKVSSAVREQLLAKAREQGYDTSRLIWRGADSEIGQ